MHSRRDCLWMAQQHVNPRTSAPTVFSLFSLVIVTHTTPTPLRVFSSRSAYRVLRDASSGRALQFDALPSFLIPAQLCAPHPTTKSSRCAVLVSLLWSCVVDRHSPPVARTESHLRLRSSLFVAGLAVLPASLCCWLHWSALCSPLFPPGLRLAQPASASAITQCE